MNERKLTEQEKDEIAELAAQKAYDRFYLAVGKSVTKKLMWPPSHRKPCRKNQQLYNVFA